MVFNRVHGERDFILVILFLNSLQSVTYSTPSQTQRPAAPSQTLVSEGLTDPFLNDIKGRIQAAILAKAEAYFSAGGSAFSQNRASLKKHEKIVNYYDYQPCCASVLGLLAAQGSDRALIVVRRLFENVGYYIGEGRKKEGFAHSLRRSQLHFVLCYEHLKPVLEASETDAWGKLLAQTGEDMLSHFNGLQERNPALDNRGFGTGINHVAIAAEGIWKTGEALGRKDWQEVAAAFNDRLLAYGHPDGYFEEHTNDAREGGPSLVYTPLTAGCAHIIQRWRNTVDRDRFDKCGVFFRNFLDVHLRPLPFADERANPHGIGCYGLAIHALSPQGRGLLRMHLENVQLNRMSLEYLARLHFEIDHMETGPGAVPEPFHNGTFRITLPLGVARAGAWTLGLSAMKALNREIVPNSDYALDRQTLLFISHQSVGTIISGAKSKHHPGWSTVRKGEDAYPVRTGELKLDPDSARATVYYDSFTVNVTWIYGLEPRLIFSSANPDVLTTQLVLAAPQGTSFHINDNTTVEFGDAQRTIDNVQSVSANTWRITPGQPGRLVWFVAPFNPYTAGNKSAPSTRRPVLAVDWTQRVEFTFGVGK